MPFTVSVCGVSAVLLRPLPATATEVGLNETVPECAPTVVSVSRTLNDVLSDAPAARLVIVPLATRFPEGPENSASKLSVKPGTRTAVFDAVTATAANVPPSRTLRSGTGFGERGPAMAKRKAAPVMARFCSCTLSKLLTKWTVWPVSAPGALALKVTVRMPLLPPTAMGPKFPAVTPAPPRRRSVMLPPLGEV